MMPGLRGQVSFSGFFQPVNAVLWKGFDTARLSVAKLRVKSAVGGEAKGNTFLGPSSRAVFLNKSRALEVDLQMEAALTDEEDETYSITISNNAAALISATHTVGFLRALSTLMQLVTFRNSVAYVPQVRIEKDGPASSHRAILVDTVSHFQPVQVLVSLLDWMWSAKLNVLKLHLSGDDAFRFDLPSWPNLQSNASDGTYLCSDALKLAEAASLRGVRIVPRFSLPTHARAILEAYPQLNPTFEVDPDNPETFLDPSNSLSLTFAADLVNHAGSCFQTSWVDIGAVDLSVVKTSERRIADLDQFFASLASAADAAGIHLMGSDEVSVGLASSFSVILQAWSWSVVPVRPSVITMVPNQVSLRTSLPLPPNALGSELAFWGVTPNAMYVTVFPIAQAFADSLWSGGMFVASKRVRFVVQSAVSYRDPLVDSGTLDQSFPQVLRFLLVAKSDDLPLLQQIPVLSPELVALGLLSESFQRDALVQRLMSFVLPLESVSLTCKCSSWMIDLALVMRERAAWYANTRSSIDSSCYNKDLGLVIDGITMVLCDRNTGSTAVSSVPLQTEPPVLVVSSGGPAEGQMSLYLVIGVCVGSLLVITVLLSAAVLRFRYTRRIAAEFAAVDAVASLDDSDVVSVRNVESPAISDSSSESGDSLDQSAIVDAVQRRNGSVSDDAAQEQRSGLFFASAVKLNSSVSVNRDTESE